MQVDGDGYLLTPSRLRKSDRILASAWKQPIMLVVSVVEPCFSTPRITIQKCLPRSTEGCDAHGGGGGEGAAPRCKASAIS